MQIEISNSRAYELCSFLRIAPKEVGNVKDFAKIQRFRLAVEKAIEKYKTYLDDFVKFRQEEMKPYQQQVQDMERPADIDDEEWEKLRDEKAKELDAIYQDQIRDRVEEAAKYEEDNKMTVVDVTANEEDVNRARKLFEDKGHEFPFWATYPEGYLAVAKALQIPDID
jgi:uncharacterized protein YjaZ